MSTDSMLTLNKPRVGIAGMAYPGYHLGEEQSGAKLLEAITELQQQPLDLIHVSDIVTDDESARRIGRQLVEARPDCLVLVLATFVPDYLVVELLRHCDVPVFLWAVEREIGCLSMVGGTLITPSLYNLHKRYHLHASDIPDDRGCASLLTFARAAMLCRSLRELRVGCIGGKPPIMFSTAIDEYALAEKCGCTVIHISVEELYACADALSEVRVRDCWNAATSLVGSVRVACSDGLNSSRLALAAFELADRYRLQAISINCFPHLKSRICFGVARLNDTGIAAACEGDVHSTILMYLLQRLTGTAAFNGDVLRLYPVENAILFSHCGAGAFSLAACPGEICLQSSIETHDGLAVKYPTHLPGPLTLVNMMYGRGTLRLSVMEGRGVETDLSYEGTPLRVEFSCDVQDILRKLANYGAGHHWNACPGLHREAFRLVCEWLDISFISLSD